MKLVYRGGEVVIELPSGHTRASADKSLKQLVNRKEMPNRSKVRVNFNALDTTQWEVRED